MSNNIRLDYEALRSIDATTITANYQRIGTPLAFPARIIVIQNSSDEEVVIAFNTSKDFMIIPATTSFILDLTANKSSDSGFFLAKNQGIFVKDNGTTPTTGFVRISVIHGISS